MELLEGEAEFTKEKVEDENIINPPPPPRRSEIPMNLIFDTFPKLQTFTLVRLVT